MNTSLEDPNGRFEFNDSVGLDHFGEALGHFDQMLEALGVAHRTTADFTKFLATRPDIAKYTPTVNIDEALSPHETLSWATMPDGSAAGVVLSKRPDGNVLLIGAIPADSIHDEQMAAQQIAAYGTKYRTADIKRWLQQLEGADDDNQ